MKALLQHITVKNFTTALGITQDFVLSYQLFGRNLHTAPIVMVNHALTGNSACAGKDEIKFINGHNAFLIEYQQLEKILKPIFMKQEIRIVEQAMVNFEGKDFVSSNKISNTLPISEYQDFRKLLEKNNEKYLYETNVGAGFPLIDKIRLLHLSGENITRIKDVFSGSLSYIFNNFSVRKENFSTIVKEAMDKGLLTI